MWGSENWGEMFWGATGAPIPLLEPTAIVVLVAGLLIGAVVVARGAHASR
jgi:hypothetical protein